MKALNNDLWRSIHVFSSAVKKVRLAGLVLLLAAFLMNCFFVLFEPQSYAAFLESFSPDNNIVDINTVFFRVQGLIFFVMIVWILAVYHPVLWFTNIHWQQKKSPYVMACFLWLLLSYLPFFFLDYQGIRAMAREDSFYEFLSFLWLLLTSLSFFYLCCRDKKQQAHDMKPKRNIFFLLLGLLFFFGAGEEISWGQRVFSFETPEIAAANIQNEFNLHNMPLFDFRQSEQASEDGQFIRKTGIVELLTISNMFGYFWVILCVLIPILSILSSRVRGWLDRIRFPIVPIWIGLFFVVNYLIYYHGLQHIISYPLRHPADEVREVGYAFLFFVVTRWFINHPRI